jgi:hypothetical protein
VSDSWEGNESIRDEFRLTSDQLEAINARQREREAFVVKDSGAREEFDSGMVRDTEDGKPDFTLIRKGPMFRRWAEHMTKGAKKYARQLRGRVRALQAERRSPLRALVGG